MVDILASAVADAFLKVQAFDPEFTTAIFYPKTGDPIDLNIRIERNWNQDESALRLKTVRGEMAIEYQLAESGRLIREGEKIKIDDQIYTATAEYEQNDRTTALVKVKQ